MGAKQDSAEDPFICAIGSDWHNMCYYIAYQ